jgi:hypothetical protein
LSVKAVTGGGASRDDLAEEVGTGEGT